MFTVSDSRGKCKEFIVPVAIDGKTVDMELDTGASVTIIPQSVWTDVLASKPVDRTDVKLRSYSGHEIPVIGEAKVQVTYRDQETVLPVVITGNDGPMLISRDWLSVLKLDWGQIKQISLEPVNKLDLLQTKYSSLFDGNLGTIKGVTAHLKLKENAVPQFFKPRPVPFVLKEKIADELRRLEKIGVLEKVEFSDWATPIVPVLKPDGSVRICGDYKGVGGILDDLIITGSNDEMYFRNLEGALERMSSIGIKLKSEKCVFMKPSVEYFAFVVDRDGIHPSPRKVQAIQEVPVPENPTELKSFLGLVNYYRRFIPDMATLAHPLNRLLAQNIPWEWTKQCQEAFLKLKSILQSAPLLTHYNPKRPVRLAVDASSFGLGAVLSHVSENGEEKPIAFASRTLSSSEQNYSMIEKEALAIIFVPAASRLQRWAIQLAAYTYDIEYRASKNHGNADALSRLPRKTTGEADDWSTEGDQVNRVQIELAPITATRIREATRGDPFLSRVLHYVLHGWPAEENTPEEFRFYRAKREEFTVEDGCLLRGTRVVIPTRYRKEVLTELHLNHPGMVWMKSLARLHVWWPNLDSDIEQTVRDCADCQANRRRTPLKVSNPWIWPTRPWQRLHVDFVGPFNGGMLLVVVDAKYKWLEVVPMSSTSASATIKALRGLFAFANKPRRALIVAT
ncbi:hypothetical protein ACROYT_G030616 [Oculina patagonica]